MSLGYYVHHHGAGHRSRYDAVAPLLGDVVPISQLAIAGGLRLPSDVPPVPAIDPEAGGAFHWTPLHRGAARRSHILAEWLATHEPRGVVIDVSVETAVACRLAGVPTVVVRQLGRRRDRVHELGFRVATRLIAPWPEELDVGVAPWVRDKTDYVGYLRADESGDGKDPVADESPEAVVPPLDVQAADVVVLWGRGGGRLSERTINSIAASCDGTVWCVGAGVVDPDATGRIAPNVALLGWRTDIDSILRGSPAIIASAGNNTIAAAARWSCPLVLVPQCRPFAEQHVHASRLAALGAAVVADEVDGGHEWPDRLSQARSCAKRLGAMYRTGGAQRFADSILETFGDGDR